jgi:hypothetical protein
VCALCADMHYYNDNVIDISITDSKPGSIFRPEYSIFCVQSIACVEKEGEMGGKSVPETVACVDGFSLLIYNAIVSCGHKYGYEYTICVA